MEFKKFKKIAMFTDIHWGRKNNSELHNNDCMRFIEWFCEQVRADPEIDCVGFLGDWHEHRSSISGLTLQHSYRGASKLNELGIPVFFIVGNHDCFFRNKRDVATTSHFEPLENFHIVNNGPLVLEKNKAVFFPYLFEHEYHTLVPQYANKYDVLFGHWEFKGFVVTGESRVMEHGPEHTAFDKVKKIFSGHFHKRQMQDNVVYIGNAFPGDFGDANDFERGMATYTFSTDAVEFTNWPDSPRYIRATLAEIVNNPSDFLHEGARVKTVVDDSSMSFNEISELKEELVKKYNLRELTMEEPNDLNEALKDTDVDLEGFESEPTTVIVKEMLRQVKSDSISSELLVKIYEGKV